LNSLTLSPALAGMLLRPHPAKPRAPGRIGRVLQAAVRPFQRAPDAYANAVRKTVRVRGMALAIYGGLLVLTFF
ncbi:hypothetical protein RF034_20750, partial [Serratia marcescens]